MTLLHLSITKIPVDVDKYSITSMISNLKLGVVKNIIVSSYSDYKGVSFQKALIYYKYWYNSTHSKKWNIYSEKH